MFLLTLQSLHFSDMIAAAFLHILQRVFALSALGINNGHDSKTSLPKRFLISDLILGRMFLHDQYSLFINTQCFIIKTVEIDTSNFKNDSKNGDLTYLTFVLVFKMRSICAFLTMFVLRSISISLCL